MTHGSPSAIKSNLRRDFMKRMAIKVLAVLVVVGAFNFIRAIEARKRDYDEAHNRPIVIVDDQFWTDCGGEPSETSATPPIPAAHAKCGDGRLIPVKSIRGPLGLGQDLTHPESLDELVNKIKYQNFQGESEILQRLDAEILTTADYFKKVILATRETERKAMLNKQAELKPDEPLVKEKLKSIYEKRKAEFEQRTKDPNIQFQNLDAWLTELISSAANTSLPPDETVARWRLRLTSTDSPVRKRTRSSGLRDDELVAWYRKIIDPNDKKLTVLNKSIQEIEVDAQKKIKLIYEKLQPELPGLVANALFSQPSENGFLARFSATGIYDEKSGSHVVYQTLWMTCAMVLVFGVLFGVFLVLRLLPGVADGMETLRTHAGNLFSQAGMAIPHAGKSLLVGTATLAVGAAVAVGGTAAVNQLHSAETESIRGDNSKTTDRAKTGDTIKAGPQAKPGERGSGDKANEPFTGTITVELQGPIPLSSPITVNGPDTVTLSGDSLQTLKDYITQLSQPVLSTEIETQMTEIATKIAKQIVADKVNDLGTDSLDGRLGKLENQNLESRMKVLEQGLNSFPTTIGNQLTQSLTPLKDEMTATRTAIEQLNVQPGSGPQGFFPRLKGTFKGDKYLMTHQSLTSLGLLIRTSAGQSCKTSAGNAPSCCPSASSVATCPDEIIFSSLASMVGGPPLDENAFWNKLKKIWQDKIEKAAQEKKATGLNIDDWKISILRQTRVAY